MAPALRAFLRVIAVGSVGLSIPSYAAAWTEAQVVGAHALITMDDKASAHVELALEVNVHGGWIERLELEGLDPDLELQGPARLNPGTVVTSDVPAPMGPATGEIRNRGNGTMVISFERRNAPRRGRHVIALDYVTSLAERALRPGESGWTRVEWTLPAWQSGLNGVDITFDLPKGARPAAEPNAEEVLGVTAEHTTEGDRTTLRWHRPHLPRTLSWTVVAEVPSASLDPSVLPHASGPVPHPRTARTPAGQLSENLLFWIALILLFAIVKESLFRREAFALRAEPRAWLPLPLPVRWLTAFGLAGLAIYLDVQSRDGAWFAAAALPLCFAQRNARARAALTPGIFRVTGRPDLRMARRDRARAPFGPLMALHLLSPYGLVLGSALVAACLPGMPWPAQDPLPALLVLPMLLNAGPAQLPLSPAARLGKLARFARSIRDLPTGVSMRLVSHADTEGRLQEARLWLFLPIRPSGLLRLEIALAESGELGGIARVPVLLAVAERGSAADAALERAWSEAHTLATGDATRTVRIAPAYGAWTGGIERLLQLLSAPSMSLRGLQATPAVDESAAITPVAAQPSKAA